jgi:tRNA A-37 threonylcarbamoyl transferase component Bud32
MVGNNIIVDGMSYEIIKQIGKGQAGYSYLAKNNNSYFVIKEFYDDNNLKDNIQRNYNKEIEAYYILSDIGINIPKIIFKNDLEYYYIKEYIEGNTLAYIVAKEMLSEKHIIQILKMCEKIYSKNLMLDYFPTNFIENNDILYYIDFGCEKYSDDWNFENKAKDLLSLNYFNNKC